LRELRDRIDEFTEKDALSIASWIEYLGDEDTARRIRVSPAEFKRILRDRFSQLKRFYVK
jgi:hypothetical protein